MAAFFDRCELVFEVHASGARFDHRLHQLKCIENATETGLGIRHDWGEIVDVACFAWVAPLRPLNLVCASEGVVDAAHDHWHGIDRIERLVRIHFTGHVGVARDLPARQINRLEAGLNLLHGLVACQGAQCVHEGLGMEQAPELFGATTGQGVFGLDRTAQPDDFVSRIPTLDTVPTRALGPFFLQFLCFEFTSGHDGTPFEGPWEGFLLNRLPLEWCGATRKITTLE